MKKLNKRVVRLTESKLKQIVSESIRKVLKENEESANPVDSAPVKEAFKNWMERNNIKCGYFDWDMDDEYHHTARHRNMTLNVPKFEVEIPYDDMLVCVVEQYYPLEYDYTDEGLINWFNNNAPDVDVKDFISRMNELAKERYEEELSDWWGEVDFEYDEWLDAQEEYRNQYGKW